jgi:DNA-binding SARP family transcriptional activator
VSVELGVLGPVELVREGDRVALGGPKQRLALGLLTAWRGRIVPVDDLIDGIWPEGPPVWPRKTVQVYVTRLRRALGSYAEAIRSEAAGYRLDPAVVPVDADAFERDLRAAASETRVDGAIGCLRAALGRWRGDAFADLRDCAAIVPSAVQLDARRLEAMYQLFDREVQLRPREVLAELQRAVEANPLHEGFVAQLMTAQYRSGRQTDALATYQRLRRRLIESGLDAGRGVRELEARILRHEIDVAPRPAGAGPERQRRRVTVVAAEVTVESIEGIPVDPEEELVLGAPVRRAVKGRLVERGGIVLAEVGGELSACFGYPSTEDSTERAVTAALAARDVAAVADTRVTIRIGADTGVVIVENARHGEGDQGELTGVVGPLLGSAAHLRALADPGEVCLGAATAAAVEGRFVVDRRDAATAIAVRALDQHPLWCGAEGLLGRSRDLVAMAAIAERADSRLCAVLVAGPPGVGKSALVEAFVGGLDGSWSTVRLHCDPRQSTMPLQPFRRPFPDLFNGDSEPSARRIIRALQQRWAGRRPVLVVEDVHAADPSTRETLDELPDWLPGGLLVMTSRSSSPLELHGDVVPCVVLGPLERTTARALARARAGSWRLRIHVLNEIADRSAGLPLHVLALTDAAVDQRAVSPGDPKAQGTVPESLYDSLMAQLDRLGPDRALAQRCAVVGDPFFSDDLAVVSDEGFDGAGDRLATLVDAGVLVIEDGHYRFAHALLAQAAYDSLLNADRAALHARIAEALPAAVATSEPERLAYHLEASGRRFDGAVAWQRASGRAIGHARFKEAQHHARRAVALFDEIEPAGWTDGGDSRHRALINLAISLSTTSHGSTELAAVIKDACRSGAGDGELLAAPPIRVIDIINRQALGDFRGATDVAQRLLDDAHCGKSEQAIAIAHHFLGATLVWRGALPEGTTELRLAAAHLDDIEGSPTAIRLTVPLWTMLALAAAIGDRRDEADRMFERARSKLTPGDAYRQCMLGSMVAIVDQLAGRAGKVRHDMEPVWSMATELGSDFWVTWSQVLLGWAIADEDGPSGVAMMVEAVDASATRQIMPYANLLLGSRLCEHGDVADGLARLAAGVALAGKTGEELWLPPLQLERARWLHVEGDVDAAAAARADAMVRATTMGATCPSYGPPRMMSKPSRASASSRPTRPAPARSGSLLRPDDALS